MIARSGSVITDVMPFGDEMSLAVVKTFYAAPGAAGNGLSPETPGNVRALCALAHREALESDCKVVLLNGIYTNHFHWQKLGRREHTITIESNQPHGAVFQSCADPSNQYGGTVEIGRARRLIFRGIAFKQADDPHFRGTNHFKIYGTQNSPSEDVVVDNCSFVDLGVGTGCLTVKAVSHRVTISNCHFARQWPKDGPYYSNGRRRSGNHMIYSDGSSHIRISRCRFHDSFGGSYVKFKLGVRNSHVVDCEFLRTNTTSPENGPLSSVFVQINNNETPPCTGISVIRNTFINFGNDDAKGIWKRGRVPRGVFDGNIAVGNIAFANIRNDGPEPEYDIEPEETVDAIPSSVAVDPEDELRTA